MGLGLDPTIEKHLREDGRADLHVVVEGIEHTLEVQLSPIPIAEWRTRDARYRNGGRRVTWLFGLEAGVARSANADKDHVGYDIRDCPREPAAGQPSSTYGVLIGTRAVLTDEDAHVYWSPLDACTFDSAGLHTPDIEAMQAVIEQAHARRNLERAGEGAHSILKQKATTKPPVRQHPLEEISWLTDWPKPDPPAHEPLTLQRWRTRHGESATWNPPEGIGWGWADHLSQPERGAARFFAYLTQEIFMSAPISQFDVDGVGGADQVLEALFNSGLIRPADRSGVARWERGRWPT